MGLLGPCAVGSAVTLGPLALKGASRKWAGIAPRASTNVLPSDERMETGDEGRGGSAIAAEAGGEIEERKDGGGCSHVSVGKKELSGDRERIGSPFIAAVGMTEVLVCNCLGENPSGA